MSINDELQRIVKAKSDIIAAIKNKNVDVPNDVSIEDLSQYIEEIIVTPKPPELEGVQIGTQIWLNKSLDVDDGGEGIVKRNLTINGVDLGTQYYYTWDAARRVVASLTDWHLPTDTEVDTLISSIGGYKKGNKLQSTYAWNNNQNGTDDEYGFCALPCGYYSYKNQTFNSDGNVYCFWSRNTNTTNPSRLIETDIFTFVSREEFNPDANNVKAFQVRLIKS